MEIEIGYVLKIYKWKIAVVTTSIEYSLEVKEKIDNPSIIIVKQLFKSER